LKVWEEEFVLCPLPEVLTPGEENDFSKLEMIARAIAITIKVTNASSAARIIGLG
jgi:hypothetical protein